MGLLSKTSYAINSLAATTAIRDAYSCTTGGNVTGQRLNFTLSRDVHSWVFIYLIILSVIGYLLIEYYKNHLLKKN
jgi:hypothetical protein